MSMKSVFLAVSVVAAGVASAAITSRSYVQGGLVAQYDGINNVGHDAAHDDSAATVACAAYLSFQKSGAFIFASNAASSSSRFGIARNSPS